MDRPRPAWQLAHTSSSVVRKEKSCVFLQNAYPRYIKPQILKLTITRGQSNFIKVFIFVSCEENGYYRVVIVSLR